VAIVMHEDGNRSHVNVHPGATLSGELDRSRGLPRAPAGPARSSIDIHTLVRVRAAGGAVCEIMCCEPANKVLDQVLGC